MSYIPDPSDPNGPYIWVDDATSDAMYAAPDTTTTAPATTTSTTSPTYSPGPPTPGVSYGTPQSVEDVRRLFQAYLGRDPTPSEADSWIGNPSAESIIAGTYEAQQYRAKQTASPTAPTAPGTNPPAGPQNGDYQGWFTSLVQGKPFGQQTLLDLEPTLKQYGLSLEPANAAGERTKIRLPDGRVFRVGFGEGSWQWLGQPGPSAGAAGGAPTSGTATPGNFYEAPGAFSYPEFAPPESELPKPFSYPEFIAPSGEQVLAEDPGYQFRVGEGKRTLENTASAEGLLKTGGFAKSLLDYGQGLGAQEYGSAFNRKFGTWQANKGNQAENYDRQWRDILTRYGLAENTYKTNLGKATTGYGFGLDVAAGKAGGLAGATQFGLNAQNSQFGNLLDLYKAATANLPRYQPTAQYGFGG